MRGGGGGGALSLIRLSIEKAPSLRNSLQVSLSYNCFLFVRSFLFPITHLLSFL